MRFLVIAFIRFYQKFISPYKGFRCASGVYYAEGTCSGIVLGIVREQGVMQGWSDIVGQFKRCRLAAQALDNIKRNEMHMLKQQKPKRASSRLTACDCLPAACVLPDPSDCGLGVAAEGSSGACTGVIAGVGEFATGALGAAAGACSCF